MNDTTIINRDGDNIEGKCCGNGKWEAQCSEDYTINYDNCTALKPCDSTETLEFEVKELEGTSNGSIEVSEFLSAESQVLTVFFIVFLIEYHFKFVIDFVSKLYGLGR